MSILYVFFFFHVYPFCSFIYLHCLAVKWAYHELCKTCINCINSAFDTDEFAEQVIKTFRYNVAHKTVKSLQSVLNIRVTADAAIENEHKKIEDLMLKFSLFEDRPALPSAPTQQITPTERQQLI